ncbi:MAG: hypothetical protein IPI48_11605 [bacterium]|nr:hypothetical protein [bacterium]
MSGKGDIMRINIARMVALVLTSSGGLRWGRRSRASQLAAAAEVECLDGAHVVTVAGSYFAPVAGEYDHLVLRREAIGICEPAVYLEDTPLPFEPVDEGGYSRFSSTVAVIPPRDDVVYRYVPFAVRPDGSRQHLTHNCDADIRSYALTNCGTAPFLRGRVDFTIVGGPQFFFWIVPCEADCWTEFMSGQLGESELTALAGESAFGLIGQVVDVYGRRTYCGMPGDPGFIITGVERTVDGACGPVPVEAVGWGHVKAMYR